MIFLLLLWAAEAPFPVSSGAVWVAPGTDNEAPVADKLWVAEGK